jgi:competence protein ComEC
VALPVLLLASSIAGGWWSSRHTVTLTVLALRSGAALFVDAPGRHNDLLLDCGDEGSVKNSVGPFLQAQGVNRLACLAVTHGDIRHVGGAETTLKAFRVHRVAVSGAPSRSPSYRRLLHSLDTRPERRAWVHAGDGLAGWTVLHPAQGESHPQADDNVLVLGGTVEQVRVLLLGDLGTAGQAALLRRGTDLRADIVVVGLPARGEPLSEALMAAIQPRLIVLQDAEYPVSERAGPKLIARLERHGIPICSASTDGTITLRLSAGHWEARAMRGRSVTSARPGIARD